MPNFNAKTLEVEGAECFIRCPALSEFQAYLCKLVFDTTYYEKEVDLWKLNLKDCLNLPTFQQ